MRKVSWQTVESRPSSNMDDETRVLLTKVRNWIEMGKDSADEAELLQEIETALEMDSAEAGVQSANDTFAKILERTD